MTRQIFISLLRQSAAARFDVLSVKDVVDEKDLNRWDFRRC